jgi:hypothetical protein
MSDGKVWAESDRAACDRLFEVLRAIRGALAPGWQLSTAGTSAGSQITVGKLVFSDHSPHRPPRVSDEIAPPPLRSAMRKMQVARQAELIALVRRSTAIMG